MQINLAPAQYRREKGISRRAGELCAGFGRKAMLVGGRTALRLASDRLLSGLAAAGIDAVTVWYGGECSWGNIEALCGRIEEVQPDWLLAAGGGKAIDTAKAAAYRCGLPVVTLPTIAATCAAWTPLSIIYTPDGIFQEATRQAAVPACVLADPEIIVNAPARYLTAGLGDTLAKWYETDAAYGKAPHTAATMAAHNLSRLCREVVFNYGAAARAGAAAGVVTEAVNHAVDAIIAVGGMVSDLGGDECASAGAHPVASGFSGLAAAHRMYHGELVAFGIIAQLVLEGKSQEVLTEVLAFNTDVGLPVTLADLGVADGPEIDTVAARAVQAEDIRNLPFAVTPELMAAAIRGADAAGRAYRAVRAAGNA